MENSDERIDANTIQPANNVDEQKIISLNMFMVLCITSFGLYSIWWSYKAWRFFQQKDDLDIMPIARTVFGIFYMTSLFNTILYFANEKDYEETYSSAGLFLGFVFVNLLSKLPDPYWLVSIFSFVFLIQPFKALNYAKLNSNNFVVTEQTSFSGRQLGLIIFGLIFWGLVLKGLSM